MNQVRDIKKDPVHLNTTSYEALYAAGYHHKYPNENMVRLVCSYFGSTGKGEKVLDYGCGSGGNLRMLLDFGYQVSGIDVSSNVIKSLGQSLHKHYDSNLYDLKIIEDSTTQLPYLDNSFDKILTNQTVYFLASEEKIKSLLTEFKRVLKPGGKIIISMMSRLNTYCINGTPLGDDIYRYKQSDIETYDVFITRDETHLRDVFSAVAIDQIGWFDNYYNGISGHHYVLLAHNPKKT